MQRFRGLTRREFLKLISLAPLGIYSRPLSKLAAAANAGTPNIIIIVFDAWSQHNASLYGYPRHNMPNLEKFAEKATIYHNHYSTGTFTVPGTSSMLTGMHPWSHRAFHLGGGVAHPHIKHNIFAALSSTHSTLGFTQNKLADQILYQVEADLDQHVKSWFFTVQNANLYGSPIFSKDARIAFASLDDNIVQEGEGFDSSLFFGPLYRLHILRDQLRSKEQYGDYYPLGLPTSPGQFLLDDVVDGSIDLLKTIQQPTLAYFHFLPPHEPYKPTSDFFETFMDGWNAPDKPVHDLSEKKTKLEKLHLQRRYYDEFIASWDHEVARLFQFLKESGLTENSYIIITADHGELFERGDLGHVTKMLYDPVVHVPLIISSPGQTAREDVHTITSSVDLLPTIAHLTGNPIPDWSEGIILPKLGGEVEEGRSIFSMDAKLNSSFGPLVNYSMSLTRNRHRLVSYSYPKDNYEKYEFYDLEADPQEMKDLYASNPSLAIEMQDELMQKVHEVNKPFTNNGL
jgi:arylsulfatase A-like enzyme